MKATTTSKRSRSEDASQLKKGELARFVAHGRARVVSNKGNMVKVIRAQLKMSQAEFARAFHLSLRTVQEWEQGRHQPDQIARNYLDVIRKQPKIVRKLLEER